jgi:hypothetical protein
MKSKLHQEEKEILEESNQAALMEAWSGYFGA